MELFPFSFIDDFKTLHWKNQIKNLTNGIVLISFDNETICLERFDCWDSCKRSPFYFHTPKNKHEWSIIYKLIHLFSSEVGYYLSNEININFSFTVNIYHRFMSTNCTCSSCRIINYSDVNDLFMYLYDINSPILKDITLKNFDNDFDSYQNWIDNLENQIYLLKKKGR